MNLGLSKNKKITLDFRKLTLFFVCVYVISIYLGYVSGIISSIGSVSLIAMSGCAVMTILTERKMKVNSYVIWYALFVFICVISSLYAPIGTNIISSLYSLVVILVIGIVLSFAIKEEKDIEIIFALIVIASTLLMAYLFVTGYIAEYEASEESGKRFGNEFAGNSNTFAAIFMIATCASVYFFFAEKKRVIKVLCVIPFLLQLYGLILAGSRKNVLIPFLMIFLISLQTKNKNEKYNLLLKSALMIVFIFGGYWLLMNIPFLYENIGYRFETVVNYETGVATSADASAMIRESMREKATELWKQKPFFGNGLNAFSNIGGYGTYSHNNLVELLCNNGLIGAIVYYAFFVYLIVKLIYQKNSKSIFKTFAIAFLACMIFYDYGAVSFSLIPNHILIVICDNMCKQLKEKSDFNEQN